MWTQVRLRLRSDGGGDVSLEKKKESQRRGTGCRTEACQRQRACLKEENLALTRALRVEREQRATLIAGELRAAGSRVIEMQRGVELDAGALKKLRCERSRWERLAGELGSLSVEQTNEIASLKEQIAALNTLLKERAREAEHALQKERAERKKRDREARRQQRVDFDASMQAEAARAASAAEREQEAARRAEEAEEERLQAEQRVAETGEEARHWKEMAESAREDAIREAEIKAAATDSSHEWTVRLLEKRLERAEARVQKTRTLAKVPESRTPEQWARLKAEAAKKAQRRERMAIGAFLDSHEWRLPDLAAELSKRGLLASLADTEPGTALHIARVQQLMSDLERRDFGTEFGLYLHFEMQLTLPKVHRVMQAASKKYCAATNRYEAKALWYDKHRTNTLVKVPRICPPVYKLQKVCNHIYQQLGTQLADDGRIAYKSLGVVMQELLARDCGKYEMPSLATFAARELSLPIVFSWDATGFGNQQFTTLVINNPYTPQSAQLLHILGLGNCSDGRDGSRRLMGTNLPIMNQMFAAQRNDLSWQIGEAKVNLEPSVVCDVSALRHCEHMANAGWCCCPREAALRKVPVKPDTVDEMMPLLATCESPKFHKRCVWSHNNIPGESLPRPCTAPGCTFAHNPETALAEQTAMYEFEVELLKDQTRAGKKKHLDWRKQHWLTHGNIQPGKFGEPLLHHDLDSQLLDPLHYAKLGIPKTPWKHGLLNNASDDARETISEQLKAWGHPLDTRRKEDNRVRRQKWFTGEAWGSFCGGKGGSPGGPIAIAALVKIVADDLETRGVSDGSGVIGADDSDIDGAQIATGGGAGSGDGGAGSAGGRGGARGGRGRGRGGRGRANFVRAANVRAIPVQDAEEADAELPYVPTALERAADPAHLELIRSRYGSRAPTLINVLLAFDGYFNWYYPLFDSIPFRCNMDVRYGRALSNCRTAIDMFEITERVTIHCHKSFLFHGAIFKVSRDILKV